MGSTKTTYYIQLFADMLFKFENSEAKMSIKIHRMFSHLNGFSENLGELSEEQGERFQTDIKVIKERYQRSWDTTRWQTNAGIFSNRDHLLLILESLTRGNLLHRYNRFNKIE